MNKFVVRNEQIDRFRRNAEEDLARKIRDDLEAHHEPVIRGLTQIELAQRIRTGIERAKLHGLSKKYAVAMFVELMFLVGPSFDEYPPAAAILKRIDLPPDSRVDHIVNTFTEDQWQGARRRYDASAWESRS